MCRHGGRALAGFALAASLAIAGCGSPPSAIDDPCPAAQAAVERAIQDVLDAAAKKDFARLEALHLYGPKFTKFDDAVPDRMDADATRALERVGLEAIAAFRSEVKDLKVDVFGSVAIATFLMPYEVDLVGSPVQTVEGNARATLVLVDDGTRWRIAHEHFSPHQPR